MCRILFGMAVLLVSICWAHLWRTYCCGVGGHPRGQLAAIFSQAGLFCSLCRCPHYWRGWLQFSLPILSQHFRLRSSTSWGVEVVALSECMDSLAWPLLLVVLYIL